VHRLAADIGIDDAQGRLDHRSAIIDLCDDAVSIVLLIEADRDARPFGRRVAAGLIGQHITMVVGVNTGNDDAGLVGFVARTYRRIDRNNDSDQFRHIAMCRPSGIFDARSIPQSARHIIEDLGVELLATEPGSFVFPNDLFEKRRSQIRPVVDAVSIVLPIEADRDARPFGRRVAAGTSPKRLPAAGAVAGRCATLA
jgi:hypothetical protein